MFYAVIMNQRTLEWETMALVSLEPMDLDRMQDASIVRDLSKP